MLISIGRATRKWATQGNPWTNVYGVARTLLALGTLGTLAASEASSIFRPAVGVPNVPVCTDFGQFSFFCIIPIDNLEALRWIAVLVLAVVASGWRPRFTGAMHWWVSASLVTSGVLTDGGDQVTQVLTLLVLPVTLTDERKWHWNADPLWQSVVSLKKMVALSTMVVIRLQVAFIYFHAAIGKILVPEWRNGTAVFYWFSDPMFGAPEYLQPLVYPIVRSGTVVSVLTWGTIMLELFLFVGLVIERRFRKPLLFMGIVFHALIALIHGLPSFTLAMWGALILLLRDPSEPFSLPRTLRAVIRHLRSPWWRGEEPSFSA